MFVVQLASPVAVAVKKVLKAGYLSQPGHVKAADALPRSARASRTERRRPAHAGRGHAVLAAASPARRAYCCGACPPPELDRPESEEARAARLRTHCATVSRGIGVCSAVVRGCTRLGALYVGTSRPSSARAPSGEPTQRAAAAAAAERTSTHAKAAERRERAREHSEVRS